MTWRVMGREPLCPKDIDTRAAKSPEVVEEYLSTAQRTTPEFAWIIDMFAGFAVPTHKDDTRLVWPVCGPASSSSARAGGRAVPGPTG